MNRASTWMMSTWLAAACCAAASDLPPPAYIEAAVRDPDRPAQEVALDTGRKPAELLAFAGIKPGDRVADFMSGNGYFTRLLSRIVGPRGQVYAFLPTQELAHCSPDETAGTRELEHDRRYRNVQVLIDAADHFGSPEPLDVVWTAQNYHDLHDEFMAPTNVATLNARIFKALRPGGIFLVIDHVAEPGSGLRDTDTLHRIDPAVIRSEVTAAGFVFESQSDVLRNPEDAHDRPVFDPAIRHRTDQVVYKFKKPSAQPSSFTKGNKPEHFDDIQDPEFSIISGYQGGTMLRKQHLPRARSLVAIATLMTILGGCGGASINSPIVGGATTSTPVNGTATPTAVVEAQKANTPVDPAIAIADSAFGLNLLNTLMPGSSGGNVAISPLSVALALQIIYNGAEGPTQTAMAQTLQLGSLSTAGLNDDNAALQAALLDPDANVQLTVANSLWMHLSDNPVSTSFVDTDQTYYGATIGDLSGAPANVNAWVNNATQGLIKELFPGANATFYNSLIAVIGNAIYFKGEWTYAFDPTLTAAAPFTLSDGTSVTAELMNQTANFDYFQGSLLGTTFQAVRLPYGSGRLNMLIVLPDAGASLDSFVANVTPGVLTGWNSQFTSIYGRVALPRFDATYGQALDEALSTLGMSAVFCPSNGNLPGISPGACLAKVEHQTVIEVDETGTVAAGSTGGGIGITAIPSPQFTMTMSHPFFYAIQDSTTGVLLFIGVLMNPAQKSGWG